MLKIHDYSLYLVISEEYGMGRSAIEIARLAISGGIDVIQMREKNKTKDELVELACELSKLCKEKRVNFIVNDNLLIARESNADGVHLGQEDMLKYSITEARNILGKSKIIGVSTHSLVQLNSANKEDVDYIAYGPIFLTKTKDYFLGVKDIKEVLKISRKPVFFIGGIDLSNLDEILEQGGKNIAMIRGIIGSENIIGNVKKIKERMIKWKKRLL